MKIQFEMTNEQYLVFKSVWKNATDCQVWYAVNREFPSLAQNSDFDKLVAETDLAWINRVQITPSNRVLPVGKMEMQKI